MTAATIDRKYALRRITAGDYLLPANDGRTVWRIRRYTEGPSTGIADWPRDREVWGLWKWVGTVGDLEGWGFEDLDDGNRWDLWEGMFETRAQAVDEAMRLGE